LTNNLGGGTLDTTNFGQYDQLMQACLKTGTYCAIDVHNFARFNGLIIGQGGPTDAQFAALWTSLATKYATNTKVIFGLMNEPHELDVPTWANSVQAAVTAIRKAGATSQMILLPGTNFTSAGTFVSSGSADALIKVTNPDGSIDNLIFDLHKYLDVDNSGTNAECVTDNIADAFQPLAAYLRTNKRVAIISETGASNASSVRLFSPFLRSRTDTLTVRHRFLCSKHLHKRELGRLSWIDCLGSRKPFYNLP
jgi:endoglucanase